MTMRYLLSLLLSFPLFLAAQCFVSNVALTTQAEVNAMAGLDPECYLNINDLRIGDSSTPSDISDLSPLLSITSISGSLLISGNQNLTNLSGLNNLVTVGRSLVINQNTNLTSVSGLEALISVGEYLNITFNTQLSDISALENLQSLLGILIVQNSLLEQCTISPICNILAAAGSASFSNNAPGCSSRTEVSTACAILPVTLVNFIGRSSGKYVFLEWQTASESENRGFHLQHSVDGRNWATLGFVAGAGTSTAPLDYEYVHLDPVPGHNYYRLMQEDFDGTTTLSSVEEVEFSESAELALYPNPVKQTLNLNLPQAIRSGEAYEAIVYDLNGHELLRGKNQSEFSAVDLPAGVYVLRVEAAGQSWSRRFIKL